MLKVKSILIVKIIVQHIIDINKLKILKYNKYLRKIMNINLIDYKKVNGRYIIYERKGKGKEYNSEDRLIFEGEYLNGERSGQGKEYEYSELKAE